MNKAGVVNNIITFLLGLTIILWFAGFGFYPVWSGAWHRVWQLLRDTVQGINLQQLYYGASWLHIGFTCKLVGMAIIFAYLLGLIITIIPIRIRWRPAVVVLEAVSVFLESIPDTLYIILTVVFVIYLFERTGIDLPAFNEGTPTFVRTLIPAIALALPGAFYLRRVWTLQLNDEIASPYVDTAIAKGASNRRVFYRHILPNIGPITIMQLPFVATMILSTSLFTELFMEYEGQLFQFTQAVGISMEKGDLEHQYHIGTIVVIGVVLMALWWITHEIANFSLRRLYPGDFTRATSASRRKMAPGWMVTGGVMVVIVLFAGAFPQLFTHFSPSYRDMGNLNQVGPPYVPWPPSQVHPFGTDTLGRDVLADTLYGVYQSLYPAVIITICAVFAGVVVAVFATIRQGGWLARILRIASNCMSSIPTLFILFLALYQRIDIVWLQLVQYMLWFVLIEALRSSYPMYMSIQSWFQFAFIEGAYSIGQSRWSILRTHLRPWLGRYVLEFSFSTFVRVMSLMTQLAALHIYAEITIGDLPFKQFNEYLWPMGILSAHFTWFGMIGNSALTMNFLSNPAYLAAPVIALALTVIGVNLIARGIRGGSRAV